MTNSITLKDLRPTLVYHRKINANYATNGIDLLIKSLNKTVRVCGFCGVVNTKSFVWEGGFTWIENNTIYSTVFSVAHSKGKTIVTVPECTYSQDFDLIIDDIQSFLDKTIPNILEKLIRKELNLSSGGGGLPHPFLQAWKRRGRKNQAKFNVGQNVKFTKEFIKKAVRLSIHYF